MTASDSAQIPPLAGFGVDRAASERMNEDLLDEARMDAATRVLVIAGDAAPLGAPGELEWLRPDAVPDGGQWAFLGRDAGGEAMLTAVFDPAETELFAAPAGWAGLRAIGGDLSAHDGSAFVEALSLGRWLLDSPYCPACGALTLLADAGWSRRCPSCGRQHFPRTDPAVIVAIESADAPHRLLLGSNALWGANRFSCFAGFVEAGESLEATVRREVREECGVDAVDIRYRGSQAWPYPRSLMVGFLATAVDDAAAEPDGEEIVAVRWFSREEIGAGLARESELLLPGTASIAHRLIRGWFEGAP